ARWKDQAEQDLDRRGLARSVRAEKSEDLVFVDLEGNATHGFDLARERRAAGPSREPALGGGRFLAGCARRKADETEREGLGEIGRTNDRASAVHGVVVNGARPKAQRACRRSASMIFAVSCESIPGCNGSAMPPSTMVSATGKLRPRLTACRA